jgi:rhodanese-related sulfurtransferase
MRTNDPDIYAVGDAIEVTDFVGGFKTLIPLAGPANRQGRIAADNILGRDSVYRNTQGTAIVKVFDLAAGMTGLSEKVLKRRGIPYEKIFVHPASHAGYYPGASPISLKLLFDPTDGRILGAQAVGADGVDKRIDVIAVAIRAGMTVRDLQDLELSYAPPYGSAKDPVNYAGFVASNVIAGDMRLCTVEEMLEPSNDQIILDVRTPAEVLGGTIPGAINIPVDDLLRRMNELPRDKEILVTCQVGLRGYLGCRILSQHGYRCRNLSGGYKTFSNAVSARRDLEPVSPVEKDMLDDTGECGPVCAAPEAKKAEAG